MVHCSSDMQHSVLLWVKRFIKMISYISLKQISTFFVQQHNFFSIYRFYKRAIKVLQAALFANASISGKNSFLAKLVYNQLKWKL